MVFSSKIGKTRVLFATLCVFFLTVRHLWFFLCCRCIHPLTFYVRLICILRCFIPKCLDICGSEHINFVIIFTFLPICSYIFPLFVPWLYCHFHRQKLFPLCKLRFCCIFIIPSRCSQPQCVRWGVRQAPRCRSRNSPWRGVLCGVSGKADFLPLNLIGLFPPPQLLDSFILYCSGKSKR